MVQQFLYSLSKMINSSPAKLINRPNCQNNFPGMETICAASRSPNPTFVLLILFLILLPPLMIDVLFHLRGASELPLAEVLLRKTLLRRISGGEDNARKAHQNPHL